MNAERVTELEKDVAVMKSIVPSLMQKMDKATEAQIGLTNEIKNLVESNARSESRLQNLEASMIDLKTKEAVRQSGDQLILWIKRAVVISLTAGIMSLLIIKG